MDPANSTTVVIAVIDFSASCDLPAPHWLRRLLLSGVYGLAWCLRLRFRAVCAVSERHTVGGQRITVPLGVRLMGEGESAQLESPTKWVGRHSPYQATAGRN